MYGFVAGYYKFSVWITRFAYLNLLWVIFSIVGIGVFGFLPATTAMFSVTRKWMMGEKDIPIFKTFWSTYKNDFIKVNGLGWILLIIGYLLVIEFKILRLQDQFIYVIASFAVISLFILYIIVLAYFFPIYVHFQLRLVDYFKWPLIIGIIHPILTVVMVVGVSFLYYVVFITIPALLFFFGGSVAAFILMWGASQTFTKYEARKI